MSEHVFRKSQGYPDRRLMHPQREWGIGLLFFGFLVILGSILAGNIFVMYRDVGTTEGNAGESVPQYRTTIVQDALELYRTRNEKYKRMRENVLPASVEVAASSSVPERVVDVTIEDAG